MVCFLTAAPSAVLGHGGRCAPSRGWFEGPPVSHVHSLSLALKFPPPPFMLPPQAALFLAIDVHCRMQDMDCRAQSPLTEDDHVVYYVNRDFAGWVQQRVRRRVYLELKLECTRNRSRDVQKSRDDWLCLYCRGQFPSKLHSRIIEL